MCNNLLYSNNFPVFGNNTVSENYSFNKKKTKEYFFPVENCDNFFEILQGRLNDIEFGDLKNDSNILDDLPICETILKKGNILGEYYSKTRHIEYYKQTPEILEITKIHERFHAVHHLTLDKNGAIWDEFPTVPSFFKELLAQLFTWIHIRDNNSNLIQDFRDLNSTQPLIYQTYKIFHHYDSQQAEDHYGLSNFVHRNVMHFLGEATHKIIEISNLFTPQEVNIANVTYFEKGKAFLIGDFTITPYWADHSAFDSYSFLVEAFGKSIFYSGDFRDHGRKSNAFKWFTHNAPQNVDYLLLEGTTIGRGTKPFKTESKIESELTDVFKQEGKINLIYTSGQNIDRLVSIYKACINTDKILVADVYVATILKELSKFARLPFPSIVG